MDPATEDPTEGGQGAFQDLFATLQERLGGDRDAALAVCAIFLRDAPVQLQQLSEAVEAGAGERARFLAHSLNGSLLWMGADTVAASARSLELSPSSPGLMTLRAGLEALLHRVRDAMASD